MHVSVSASVRVIVRRAFAYSGQPKTLRLNSPIGITTFHVCEDRVWTLFACCCHESCHEKKKKLDTISPNLSE